MAVLRRLLVEAHAVPEHIAADPAAAGVRILPVGRDDRFAPAFEAISTSNTGAPSTCTDAGPPERMIAFGLRASISAAGIVRETISL